MRQPWPPSVPGQRSSSAPHAPISGLSPPRGPAPGLLRGLPLELSSGKGTADFRTGQGGPDHRPECPLELDVDVCPGLTDLIITG